MCNHSSQHFLAFQLWQQEWEKLKLLWPGRLSLIFVLWHYQRKWKCWKTLSLWSLPTGLLCLVECAAATVYFLVLLSSNERGSFEGLSCRGWPGYIIQEVWPVSSFVFKELTLELTTSQRSSTYWTVWQLIPKIKTHPRVQDEKDLIKNKHFQQKKNFKKLL